MLVIGHRGACGYAPENSMPSIEYALTLGVDMIECDIRMCASGELVLLHDARIDRTSNGVGYARDMTLQQLQALSFQGTRIVTVNELLNAINGRVKINFEIKERGIILSLARMLQQAVQTGPWKIGDFIITSFIHQELMLLKNTYPEFICGPLIACSPIAYGLCIKDMPCEIVVLDLETISTAFVDDLHNRGKQVFVYTVNHIQDIERMIDMLVDGIISNYPDRIIELQKSGS